MTINEDDRVDTVLKAVRNFEYDRVIQAARDVRAAMHGLDVAGTLEGMRATQKALDHVDVGDIERRVRAATPVINQVTAAARQMARSLGPVLDRLNVWVAATAPLLEEWYRHAAALAETAEQLQPALKRFQERKQTHDALDSVGWLPHPAVPYRIVRECRGDPALLDACIADFYRTRWVEIRDQMTADLANYHIDDEARATFHEALAAHEAGLYRCVCRALFPEIERMIGAGPPAGSKKMVQKLMESGDPRDRRFRELFDWVMLERIRNHAYEEVRTEDQRERFERDAVPNRHAAMHGRVAYSTHKHSMNMLILTDYVFRILPPIRDSHA